MTPLIGSMFGLINAFNPEIYENSPSNDTSNRSKYTHFKENKDYDRNYFTNSGTKDTNVYDLWKFTKLYFIQHISKSQNFKGYFIIIFLAYQINNIRIFKY